MIPYSPPPESIRGPSLPLVGGFDDEPFSSQTFWDQFPSPSSEDMEVVSENIKLDPSPPKVVTKEINFISNLKMETPLTPISIGKSTIKYKQEFRHDFPGLQSSVIPQSQESPGSSTSQIIDGVGNKLFQETFSAESSLRLLLPQLPSASPKQNTFPISMFGIYIADEGLHCGGIATSIIDSSHHEVKWQPFTKPSMTINRWSEELEGEWEDFVDYTGRTVDGEILVLAREMRTEEEEALELLINDTALVSTQDKRKEFMDVLEIVKKRKVVYEQNQEKDVKANGNEGGFKRSRLSQNNRMGEFLQARGHSAPDLSGEEVPERILIRMSFLPDTLTIVGESNSTSSIYSTPNPTLHTEQEALGPSLDLLDPTKAVPAIILSTSILHHHFLTEFLRQTFLHTVFFERDLTTNNEVDREGDIILSPNRCILFFTLAQVTQALPSNTSSRILAVAMKYRQIEILVSCAGSINGKALALFSGWLEKVRRDYNVRMVFSNGEKEIIRWTGWFCLRREVDGCVNGKEYINDEETEVT
jgi:hypothetical protein